MQDNDGEKIEGAFYKPELQKIGKDKVFKKRKAFKKRKSWLKTPETEKKKKILLKWVGWPKKLNFIFGFWRKIKMEKDCCEQN